MSFLNFPSFLRPFSGSLAALTFVAACGLSSVASANPDIAKVPEAESVYSGLVSQNAPIAESTVNVNTATAEQMSRVLKGVGLKKAQAIVEWREHNGSFTYLEQLLAVKGIGEKTLSDNQSLIEL